MRRSGLQIYQVHIADGFSSDCDELVHRCLQVDNLDFQKFCKIWKEMNFDLLYQGRSSSPEIAELSEEFIHIAKHYMVKDTSYYVESVTGLFLVYGLLNLQPFSGFAMLRLVPDDVTAITRLELVARRERKLDVLYILGEVLFKWTQYHADERPRGMESSLRKYLDGFTSIDKMGMRPMGVFYRQNEELDHIRDLGAITRQYTLAKKCLSDAGSSDPSLEYINENLANELNSSLRKLVNGIIDESEDDNDLDEDGGKNRADDEAAEEKMSEERSRTVQAIKQKAMSKTADPMKHLICAEDRKKTNPNSPSKSDLKIPTGKIKTGGHTKVVTTSPKKRKIQEKLPKKKTPKKSDKEKITEDTDTDLNIEHFNKNPIELTLDDSTEEQEDTSEEIYKEVGLRKEQSIDIEIESLPLIMRTGNWGDEIEIEIIDHTKASQSKQTEAKPEIIMPHKDTSSSDEDYDEPLSLDRNKRPRTYKKERNKYIDFKNDSYIKKPERREQKRREVKSKFKKMGILPIANFSESNQERKIKGSKRK